MSMNQGGPELRFNAGKYERTVIDAIMLIQMTLVGVAGLIGAGILFLSIDFSAVYTMVPVMVALVGGAVLLNKLYE